MDEEKRTLGIEDLLVILTKPTIDRLLKEKDPADLIAMYVFYYYTAKWQETVTCKASSSYVKKGLKWGHDRFIKTKRKLVSLNLIEDITRKDAHGKISGWYIKVNYVMFGNPPSGETQTVVSEHTNALITGSLNALNTNTINALVVTQEDDVFKRFWDLYPRKVNKPMARKSFAKVVKGFDEEKLERLLTVIASDIERRMRTKEWDIEKKTYIPHPTSYLNGYRWEDDDGYPQEGIVKKINHAKI